jgi:hypothetical protein
MSWYLTTGVHRLDDSVSYSWVIEINPATNEIVGKYQDKPAWNFSLPRMGNAQRLLTDYREGAIVWEYATPFFDKPSGGPPNSESNQVFRAVRYGAEEDRPGSKQGLSDAR